MNNQELELYIHIPFCVKKCNYCDFLSFTSEPFTRELYTNALCSEIEYKGRKLNDRIVTSIYIGGGTPSVLETKYISKIVDVINDTFTINEEAEFTIECNPGTVSRESLNVYKMLGINRLSFGVQSSNDDELKLLGRIHDYSSFINSLDYALRAGFINISADIMYGLPHQTIKTLRKTLSDVSRFNLKHLSVYSLIIEENTPFYNEYYDDYVMQSNGNLTSFLPSEDELSEMTDFVHAYLNNRGYKQYEISNYAKKGYECRHNIGYWKRKEYLGVGLGAASLLDEVRYKNITDIISGKASNHTCIYDFRISTGTIIVFNNFHPIYNMLIQYNILYLSKIFSKKTERKKTLSCRTVFSKYSFKITVVAIIFYIF